MGTCVDISIYISRLRNAEGGHVIGRSLYVVMLNKRCIIFLHVQSIFFNKYVYSIKVNINDTNSYTNKYPPKVIIFSYFSLRT